ncbi:MAG TPA: polyphosphate kinase 1 [Candidatus Binatia bacterium]|jgi:polyphosphate kinase|nr:polyphosphate kinase 1 [Candidatus Binatia bacterium]
MAVHRASRGALVLPRRAPRRRASGQAALGRYVNRELSWLEFNRRVLDEAADAKTPPLERCRFLSIFESNLDEFYMVRVSGLIEQVESGVLEPSADGLAPEEQLQRIAAAVMPLRRTASELWTRELRPALAEAGLEMLDWEELSGRQQTKLRRWFEREVFPVCTPLVLDPAPSVPFISNRSLNLAVLVQDGTDEPTLARVKIPSVLPRAVRVGRRGHVYVLLEDVIRQHLEHLFPDVPLAGTFRFRVVRDADIEIRELEAGDLIDMIEETIRRRRFGDPVRLDVGQETPPEVRDRLATLLGLDPLNVCTVDGLLGFDVLGALADMPLPALRWPVHKPFLAPQLARSDDLFAAVRRGDVLVHHPFDAFRTIEELVGAAARDPDVIAIKQTLYRVGAESPIVEALLEAAEAGKQVAVMVELKARFDESNNLVWARALERAGAHVTYGFSELKTHAKLCLVVRRESGGIRTYAHIGTGNYNPSTARVYTDLGLFTCDPEITQDILELFNFLTGISRQRHYRTLLVAPVNLRAEVLHRLQREAEHATEGRPAHVILKLNSLTDPETIDALYEVAAAGAQVDLIVRGVCCLRPGTPGLSERIRVRSIVGRFLEHSRILWFENGGEPEVLIGSADMMSRNLDRRIETLVPVTRPELVRHLRDGILDRYLADSHNAWVMGPDGTYHRATPPAGEPPFSAQDWLLTHSSSTVVRLDDPGV